MWWCQPAGNDEENRAGAGGERGVYLLHAFSPKGFIRNPLGSRYDMAANRPVTSG